MRWHGRWPYYRFELAFLHRRFLGRCTIEILAEGVGPSQPSEPVVIISQSSRHDGPSITNAMELVCSLIRVNFLDPLGIEAAAVSWYEHYLPPEESWRLVVFSPSDEDEVSFTIELPDAAQSILQESDSRPRAGALTLPEYTDPKWIDTDAPPIDYAAILGSRTQEITERRVIDFLNAPHEDFDFNADECDRVDTGICPLDQPSKLRKRTRRLGLDRCRMLGVYAQIWGLVASYLGDAFDPEIPKRWTNPEVVKYVEDHGFDLLERVPSTTELAIKTAVDIFGAVDHGKAIQCYEEDGCLSFVDGRHRACVSKRLVVPVGAFVTWQKANTD